MRHIVILGLGSNDDPKKTLDNVKKDLFEKFKVLGETPYIQTKAVGLANTADFINNAMLIETDLEFDEFRAQMKDLEIEFNPSNKKLKPLDLDILVWDGKIKKKDVYDRDFVRTAVVELLPDLKGQLC